MSDGADGPVGILVVEDAMDHALLLMAFLRELGDVDVTHAQDGDRAIQLAGARSFDLVVTDLNLPGTDGFDVIRHLKERHPDLPVLAVTGYTNPQYSEQAYRAGADGVMLKPLDKDDVLHRVREVLPRLQEEEERPPAVLAVGALPGDVEAGCGGTLLNHRASGEEIILVVLSHTMDEDGTDGSEALRHAAEYLGARVIVADHSLRDAGSAAEIQLLVERIARELKPVVAYLPSLGEDHRDRREAHRICRTALEAVPEVRAYLTATTTQEFRADVFEDVTEAMVGKLEALTAYRDVAAGRLDLSPRFAQASARYWGRFADFRDTEPFETLRSEDE